MATDPLEPKDKVRLLISDVGGDDGSKFIYTDAEIMAFLEMADENIFRAAVDALRTLAANAAQVLKVIKLLELETNGAETAEALNNTADKLESRASENEEGMEFVDWNVGPFSDRELRYRGWLLEYGEG
jgi:hypothetical protein